jgi:hypothetical protein
MASILDLSLSLADLQNCTRVAELSGPVPDERQNPLQWNMYKEDAERSSSIASSVLALARASRLTLRYVLTGRLACDLGRIDAGLASELSMEFVDAAVAARLRDPLPTTPRQASRYHEWYSVELRRLRMRLHGTFLTMDERPSMSPLRRRDPGEYVIQEEFPSPRETVEPGDEVLHDYRRSA